MQRLCILVILLSMCTCAVTAASVQDEFQRLQAIHNKGNYKDAFDGLKKLIVAAPSASAYLAESCRLSFDCLRRTNGIAELDQWRDDIYQLHKTDWKVLQELGRSVRDGAHYGYLIKNEFKRGHQRGGGQYVQVHDLDRIRALQLFYQAHQVLKPANDNERENFYVEFARTVNPYGAHESWKLQQLSDLETSLDYNAVRDHHWHHNNTQGAAVDADGRIIFYQEPEQWETAQTDGERWRWCLAQVAKISERSANYAALIRAQFCEQLFGVQTIQRYGFQLPISTEDDEKHSPWMVEYLPDNESIARLAVGVRRFSLEPAYNYIAVYKQLIENAHFKTQAANHLGNIFLNRRQYKKALGYFKISNNTHQIEQITGKFGAFQSNSTQVAGKGASLEYRFRNGDFVQFTARRIDIEMLLNDIKQHIKSQPPRIDWQTINLGNIGWRIINKDQEKYVREQVAAWDLELDPSRKHFDRNVTVQTPLQKAGAYLVTAQMRGGNTNHIVVWLNDTVLVNKRISNQQMYYVADAETGTGLDRMNVSFFGYRQRHVKNNQYRIDFTEFAEFSNADGLVQVDPKQMQNDYQWLCIARDDDGRFAYLGFNSVWYNQYHVDKYQQSKVYFITDRPVYRPEHEVHFKVWLRQPSYDQGDVSVFANQNVSLVIRNGKHEEVLKKQFTTDAFGGIDGTYTLPADANLGTYSMYIEHYGGDGSFRVEEYKKPEFEVIVEAPTEPIALGDTFSATIKARYYFGAPVNKGTLRYKVHRQGQDKQWYPVMPWDWFYGNGYWWFAPDYSWYPGFARWGCRAPYPWWFHRNQGPPELVVDNQVELNEDGTFSFEIDSSLAKAVQGDRDHVYTITAEVVDQSRRTIVGSGKITAARKPFQVNVWTSRGYYRKGDTIQVSAMAKSIDSKPIAGSGKLRLYKISYNEKREPVETEIEVWDVNTDAAGEMLQQIVAGEQGQYRISYELTDAKNRRIEGAYLFNVIGNAVQDQSFRFNDLELIVDKQSYEAGEQLQLLVNAERRNQQVLLFARASNGIYTKPQILRLEKRSQIVPINIEVVDMPNFYIEAVCVSNGQVHTVAKEIIVPPANRILGVEVVPNKTRYVPGEGAEVTLKVTDEEGKPFVGSTVVSIYDKALEYISGGSHVADIKAHFWKWRRRYHPFTVDNTGMYFHGLYKSGEKQMRHLGVFGYLTDLGGLNKEKQEAKKGNFAAPSRSRRQSIMAGAASLEMADGVMEEREGGMKDDADADELQAGDAGAEVEAQMRTNFADTAYWNANITTNERGEATVNLEMPENLSTWKIKVWSLGQGTRVGHGEQEVITSKNIIVRMQAPRFFVETDEVVLSAIAHNYLEEEKEVRVVLVLPGTELVCTEELSRTVTIEAGGEARVDWRVTVKHSGEAVVQMKALTDEESDAMEMRFPVKMHGIDKMESFSVAIRPDQQQQRIDFTIPEKRLPERSALNVRFSPSLAGAMVDALPYMLEYPYGCTEQTLNRFLPAVITQKVLMNMGLNLAAIKFKQNNLNAQELGDPKQRAEHWQMFGDKVSPVFDQAEMQRIVKKGVERLTAMQLSDGGWGWFSGWNEHSSVHTTATVVHGLQVAQQNDIAIVPGVLQRGIDWLRRHQDKRHAWIMEDREHRRANNSDAMVFMILTDAKVEHEGMKNVLFTDRLQLTPYAQSMLGLAFHSLEEEERWQLIKQNLGQFLKQDDENQTAYLDLPNASYWWYWYGSEIETHAYYLKLLSRTEPRSDTTSRLVKYLLNNRSNGHYWKSTRDTALCIEALAEFLQASGESAPNMDVEIVLDGQVVHKVHIDKENLFSFDNTFDLFGNAVTDGKHLLEIRKTGTGPIYANAYVSYFTKEDHISAAGLEVKVERLYYKLVEDKEAQQRAAGAHGQVLEQKREAFKRVPLKNLDTVVSGDLIEIELIVHSKNDYEYIAIEDFKAAGCEPFDRQSGYIQSGLRAYRELRDDRVTFFMQQLPRGSHSLSYRVRAEIPGKFSALPSKVFAMYAPELKGNAEEIKLRITDKE